MNTSSVMKIEMAPFEKHQIELLTNLWQLYIYESSERDQLEVDEKGMFKYNVEFLEDVACGSVNETGFLIQCEGEIAGFLIVELVEVENIKIKEFADIYILPKYRNKGVCSAVIGEVIIESKHPWHIAVFRNDKAAIEFWRSAFKRLDLTAREFFQSELEELHTFIVNE